jgi:hypothetical protein
MNQHLVRVAIASSLLPPCEPDQPSMRSTNVSNDRHAIAMTRSSWRAAIRGSWSGLSAMLTVDVMGFARALGDASVVTPTPAHSQRGPEGTCPSLQSIQRSRSPRRFRAPCSGARKPNWLASVVGGPRHHRRGLDGERSWRCGAGSPRGPPHAAANQSPQWRQHLTFPSGGRCRPRPCRLVRPAAGPARARR